MTKSKSAVPEGVDPVGYMVTWVGPTGKRMAGECVRTIGRTLVVRLETNEFRNVDSHAPGVVLLPASFGVRLTMPPAPVGNNQRGD